MHDEEVDRFVDLGQGQVAQQTHPGVPGIGPGVTELIQRIRDENHGEISRRDPLGAAKSVAAHRRCRSAPSDRPHPRPEQQKARQREEDRDADLHSRIERPEVAVRQLPGSVRGVRPHDEQRRDCA